VNKLLSRQASELLAKSKGKRTGYRPSAEKTGNQRSAISTQPQQRQKQRQRQRKNKLPATSYWLLAKNNGIETRHSAVDARHSAKATKLRASC